MLHEILLGIDGKVLPVLGRQHVARIAAEAFAACDIDSVVQINGVSHHVYKGIDQAGLEESFTLEILDGQGTDTIQPKALPLTSLSTLPELGDKTRVHVKVGVVRAGILGQGAKASRYAVEVVDEAGTIVGCNVWGPVAQDDSIWQVDGVLLLNNVAVDKIRKKLVVQESSSVAPHGCWGSAGAFEQPRRMKFVEWPTPIADAVSPTRGVFRDSLQQGLEPTSPVRGASQHGAMSVSPGGDGYSRVSRKSNDF